MMNTPNKATNLAIGGVLHAKATVPTGELDNARMAGMYQNADGRTNPGLKVTDNGDGTTTIEGYLHNAFVDQGLQGVLDSMYGDLVVDPITHIGVSGDSSAVTAATTSLDPSAAGNSIKTTANTVRNGNTVSANQTWSQADVNFPIFKIGLLRGATPGDVSNIIGGNGGAAPYNEPFTIDLTNITTWSLTMGIDVTLTAS